MRGTRETRDCIAGCVGERKLELHLSSKEARRDAFVCCPADSTRRWGSEALADGCRVNFNTRTGIEIEIKTESEFANRENPRIAEGGWEINMSTFVLSAQPP